MKELPRRRLREATAASIGALLALAGTGAAFAAEPTATAVEFFHPGLKAHYLAVGEPEIAAFDAGREGRGWQRTGGRFGVFAAEGDAPGTVPVCRILRAGPGELRAAVYAATAQACDPADLPAGWIAGGIAFHAFAAADTGCDADTTPVWRADSPAASEEAGAPRYTVDYTVAAKAGAAATPAFCAPLSTADREADAVRLLRQATFGPTRAEVGRVLALGTAAWLDEQLAMPATAYTDYPWVAANRPADCVDDRTRPVRPDSYCARDNYTLFPLQREFFRQSVTQPDQLRARVAFALSQIFVTSGVDNGRNYAMRHYQQILRDRAFGNFHDLLLAVTLSPVMGDYLDMVNNLKANAANGTVPNENYAREILQLFSIGLFRLNPDGSLALDAAGEPVPTYDLEEIEGFARAFTGWTYPTVPGATPRNVNPRNYLGTMRPVAANHDFGAKPLLDGVVAPANLSVEEDLAFALRTIFNHPNVGPFIGRQLIQKLVTSDPTPGYVRRVAAVFANNGAGVRGDLRAVVKAVLADPEARGAAKIDPAYGKLSEPALWLSGVLRAFGGRTDGVYPRNQSSTLAQFVFYPPSVFNYYPPDHFIAGTDVYGPEFGIHNTGTAIARANVATALVYSAQIAPDPAVYGATGTALDFSPWLATAADAGGLADRLDRELLAGRMSPAMREAITRAVNAVPVTDRLGRVRAAAWLVVTSPQYQVER